MKRKLLPLLLVAFLVVAAVVPMFAITAAAAGETTATVIIQDYADANSWASGTKYTTINIDEEITAKASGSSNTGKYYDTGEQWRIYQTENPTFTISAMTANIVSVKVTYTPYKNGTLVLNGSKISSGTTVTVNAQSITFNVGNTGTANNGQVRVTAIEVVYAASGDCAHENKTLVNDATKTYAATCLAAGQNTYECSECHEEIIETIDKLEHVIVDGICENGCGLFDLTTPEKIVTAAYAVEAGNYLVNSDTQFTLTGVITEVNDPENMTVTIVVDGMDAYPIQCYKMNCDGVSTLVVGDEITVTGRIKNFYNTIEFEYPTLDSYVPICAHANTTLEDERAASCTEVGYTGDEICDDCGATIVPGEEIPKLAHDYVNGFCSVCGEEKPSYVTITFDDLSKITSFGEKSAVVWTEGDIIVTNAKGSYNNNLAQYANPARFYSGTTVTVAYTKNIAKLVFNCNTNAYATTLADSISGSTVDGKAVTVVLDGSSNSFMCTMPAQIRVDSIEVHPVKELEITAPEFDAASMIISNDLTLNYLVKLPAGFDATTLTVKFTFNGETVEVTANPELLADGRACFALKNIAPQQIALNVEANLYCGEELLHTVAKYSVKKYIDNTLNDNPTAELKALLESVLVYAQSAKDYLGAEGEAITDKTVDATLPQPDTDLTGAAPNDENAKFYAGGVRFDYLNKIFVKVKAPNAGSIAVFAGSNEVEDYEVLPYADGFIVYVDVNPTDFDKVFTFTVADADGNNSQTITYSVNSYISAKWDDADAKVQNLVKATYAFGVAAKNYTAANEDALVNN